MPRFASLQRLLASAALIATAALAGGGAAPAAGAIPDFAAHGWEAPNGGDFILVPGSPKPVVQDPAHPYINNGIANRTGQQPNYRIGDLNNPNVKQWALDAMKKDNDEVLKGKIAFTPSQSCVPWGVPGVWLSGGPFFFIQTPKVVYMIEEGDRQARRIYMNVEHAKNPKPSWYGESVGRYEGDTLVVDTIGLNTKTFVDNFRTPHTGKLHVIERYRIVNGGKTLEVHMTVEDPDTFNQPWQAIRRFNATEDDLGENICREGNFMLFNYGIPIDETPDF
jgi:hypothetical protein